MAFWFNAPVVFADFLSVNLDPVALIITKLDVGTLPLWYVLWNITHAAGIYSSANKIFAVLRRTRSDPLSRAMGCIGELRAGSRSAGYERFGTGNLAPLAVLVPIPKPATHSKGVSNQHPHCTVNIWMYHVGSHWMAVKIYTGQQVNSQISVS